MTDPFATHGLDHLSPSQVSLYQASPGSWVLQYLLKQKRRVGAAAHRGTAVELGVMHALETRQPLEECVAAAEQEFDRLTAMSGDARREKERKGIAGMVTQGLKELGGYGAPSARQRKVEMTLDDLAVPMRGYLDAEWDNHGVLIDLKTLMALPSQIRTSHARQVAFYLLGSGQSNWTPGVTYVTPAKSVTYRVDEPRRHLDALHRGGLAIQKFLSVSSDPMELASMIAPDFDSYYWSDPETRQAAFQVWGY